MKVFHPFQISSDSYFHCIVIIEPKYNRSAFPQWEIKTEFWIYVVVHSLLDDLLMACYKRENVVDIDQDTDELMSIKSDLKF